MQTFDLTKNFSPKSRVKNAHIVFHFIKPKLAIDLGVL